MLNTMNITEIMRLTDAVYECDKLDHGQNIDSFKEISNPNRMSDRGFTSATFIDLSKVSDEEKAFLSELIRNAQTKMQLAKAQSKADKLNAGIAQIQDAANKTKAGLGSRNVNALKQVIAETIEQIDANNIVYDRLCD